MDFGTHETRSLDLDVFNGTYAQLCEWAGVELPDNPDPEPESDRTAILNEAIQAIENIK